MPGGFESWQDLCVHGCLHMLASVLWTSLTFCPGREDGLSVQQPLGSCLERAHVASPVNYCDKHLISVASRLRWLAAVCLWHEPKMLADCLDRSFDLKCSEDSKSQVPTLKSITFYARLWLSRSLSFAPSSFSLPPFVFFFPISGL